MKLHRFNVIDIAIYILLGFLAFTCFFPFWYQFVVSISTQAAFYEDIYHIIPRSFTIDNYVQIISNSKIYTGFLLSVLFTICSVLLNLVMTSMAAYALSKDFLRGSKIIFAGIIFTMFFSGGLIPYYILILKIGLRNNPLVYIIPGAISTFNLILMRNYFSSAIPAGIIDSAQIDGCNDFQTLFRIVLPISKPIAATICLFVAVGQWNDWFTPMLYISDPKLYTLAIVVREMVISADMTIARGLQEHTPVVFKAAAVMVSIIPVILIYPFIQKYFVQGIMLGSLKE